MDGDGARRGHQPQPDRQGERRPASGRGRTDPRPGRRCPRGGARRRDRAPGREAVEHPGLPRRQREADRLRHRPDRGGRRPDPDRAGHRLAGLPRSRGGHREVSDRVQRHLVPRSHALPRPHRQAAVRDRRRPVRSDGGALPDRQRRSAASGVRRLARSPAGRDDGQGPCAAVVGRPGAGLPRGGPGDRGRRDADGHPRDRPVAPGPAGPAPGCPRRRRGGVRPGSPSPSEWSRCSCSPASPSRSG